MTNIDTAHSQGHLIAPHGGELVDLKLDATNAIQLKARSRDFPSWDLTSRQIRDLELLLSGGVSPLRGFLDRGVVECVCPVMEVRIGLVWPISISLDEPGGFSESL